MKRSLLTISFIFTLSFGFSQVIFFAEDPPAVGGNYDMTYANGGSWGVADLTNTANSVQDTLAFGQDSLACSALTNGPQISTNIAVVYRGSCEFGSKALAAENAGAKACVIINNVSGAPVEMAAGADGGNVTIPVVMISNVAGAALRAEYDTGSDIEVFIGSKTNFYNNDLGMTPDRVLRPKSQMRPALITTDGNDYSHEVGARVVNFGSDDQTNVNLQCIITHGLTGTVVYNETGTAVANLTSNDSTDFSLPTFSLSSYNTGFYNMEYIVSMDNVDEFPADDTIRSNMYIGEQYGYAPANKTTMKPVSNAGYRPGAPAGGTAPSDFSTCIEFKDPNASRLAITGLNFSAIMGDDAQGNEQTIANQFIEAQLFEWNDNFTDINDQNNYAADNLVPVSGGDGQFTYSADEQDTNKYISFDEPIVLTDGQRYLGCINFFNVDIFASYNTDANYLYNSKEYLEPYAPTTSDGNTFPNGFGFDLMPAMSMQMVDASGVGIEESDENEFGSPYPNPAQGNITIPYGNKQVDNGRLTVHSLDGRVVLEENVSFSNSLTFNVSGLAEGRYIVKLNDGKSVQTYNIVVTR